VCLGKHFSRFQTCNAFNFRVKQPNKSVWPWRKKIKALRSFGTSACLPLFNDVQKISERGLTSWFASAFQDVTAFRSLPETCTEISWIAKHRHAYLYLTTSRRSQNEGSLRDLPRPVEMWPRFGVFPKYVLKSRELPFLRYLGRFYADCFSLYFKVLTACSINSTDCQESTWTRQTRWGEFK
jgi:hypothetical protein